MKKLAVIQLLVLLSFTLGAFAQQISTADALQDLRISQNTAVINQNTIRIEQVAAAVSDLTITVNRAISFMTGLGASLSVLQIIQIVMARKKERGGPALRERY